MRKITVLLIALAALLPVSGRAQTRAGVTLTGAGLGVTAAPVPALSASALQLSPAALSPVSLSPALIAPAPSLVAPAVAVAIQPAAAAPAVAAALASIKQAAAAPGKPGSEQALNGSALFDGAAKLSAPAIGDGPTSIEKLMALLERLSGQAAPARAVSAAAIKTFLKEESTAAATKISLRKESTAEIGRVHGPTLKEFERSYGADPIVSRYWPYARRPDSVNGGDRNYFLNAEASHRDFQAWLKRWEAGEPVTFSDWVAHTKQRHLIATGAARGRFHEGPGGQYDTASVYPGRLRNDAEVREGNTQYSPAVARHVDRWLGAHGYAVPPQGGGRFLQFSGMSELQLKTKRSLRAPTFERHDPYGVIHYPHALDLDLFLQLSWQHLSVSKEALVRLKAARGPPGLDALLQDPLIDHLADYYHTAITGHFFHKVNNSMLMPELDSFLEELGLPPVTQGALDIVAIRMDYQPFREYFREYLRHYVQPKAPSAAASVSVGFGKERRRFRMAGKIGDGYMGQVYQGFDEASGERVAIKTFRPERRAEGWREPLAIEADLLGRIKAPALPRALGVGRLEGGDFAGQDVLVLEFINGEPLGDRSLPGKPRAAKAAVAIAVKILETAAAIHKAGYRHNDITPANVMLVDDRPETARLMDLGNATKIGEDFPGGHQWYIPLEQRTGMMRGSVTADTYAIGGVLLYALTGRHPNDPEAMGLVGDLRLRDVILRARAKEPKARYQNAEDFLRDLKHFR